MAAEAKTGWVKMKPAEIENKVVELAKAGNSPEKIGLILRDEYGIPKVKVIGKKLTKILKENGIDKNSEIDNTSKKIDKLVKHAEKHKHDYYAKRAIVKMNARLKKMKAA